MIILLMGSLCLIGVGIGLWFYGLSFQSKSLFGGFGGLYYTLIALYTWCVAAGLLLMTGYLYVWDVRIERGRALKLLALTPIIIGALFFIVGGVVDWFERPSR